VIVTVEPFWLHVAAEAGIAPTETRKVTLNSVTGSAQRRIRRPRRTGIISSSLFRGLRAPR
jgi:hypothetical protein